MDNKDISINNEINRENNNNYKLNEIIVEGQNNKNLKKIINTNNLSVFRYT